MRHALALALCTTAAITAPATPAAAELSESRAAAELLFNEARDLAARGDYAQACPKFEASLRLDAALGTRLNLGDCYEASGKLASAWAMYKSAADVARIQKDRREKLATDRATKLEPRLPRLVVRVDGERVDGMTIVRSGSAIEPAMLGSATYVDPGRIVITARAPGRQEFTQTVDAVEGATVEVVIPTLALEGDAPGATVEAPVARANRPAAGATERVDEGAPSPGRRRRVIGLAAIGGGAALAAAGLVAGYAARNAWDSAFDDGLCDRETNACTPAGQDRTDRARSRVLLSNILVGAGLVTAGIGAYFYLTAPERPSQRAFVPTVSGDGAGIAYTGSF
jgi:hypothetical protein